MIEFKGFPARMKFTPLPNVVFSSLLPQITDIFELKVLLYIFALVYPKKGSLRFVSRQELLNQAGLTSDLKGPRDEVIPESLAALTAKGVILQMQVQDGAALEDLYFLNTEANRLALQRVRSGETALPGLKVERPLPVAPAEPSDIFTLYEQNIGMLTPLIADELREAGKHYPEVWIAEAIKEAVALNKRSWRYIARILEHWSTEGKDDGTHRGNFKKNTDPDKYVRGKYGHMVQR
jgi:DNA replication protein